MKMNEGESNNTSDKQMDEIENLINEHWKYNEFLMRNLAISWNIDFTDNERQLLEYIYRTSMRHGIKHGKELEKNSHIGTNRVCDGCGNHFEDIGKISIRVGEAIYVYCSSACVKECF